MVDGNTCQACRHRRLRPEDAKMMLQKYTGRSLQSNFSGFVRVDRHAYLLLTDRCLCRIDDRESHSSDIAVGCSIVPVGRSALKRVISANHIASDDKNSSLCDSFTDQVSPLIRRLWVAFC